MKYIVKYENGGYEQLYKYSGKEKASLHTLKMSFNPYNDWITIEERSDKVYIWINLDEDDYDTWEDIPKIVLSKKNYDEIIKVWNENVKTLKKYLVFIEHDDGSFSLEAKDKLSQEDLKQLDWDKESQERWSKN